MKSVTKCSITNLLWPSSGLPSQHLQRAAQTWPPGQHQLLVEKEEQESNEVGASGVLM